MKHLFFIFGILVLLFSCNSCDPLGLKDKCKRDYLFSIPVSLESGLDTFHIGDTIFVNMSFPIEMEDVFTGDKFDLGDFPFNTEILLVKIDQSPVSVSPGMVSYHATRGNLNILPLIGGTEAVQVQFENESGMFNFSCFIILERKGTFGIYYQSYFLDEFNSELEKGCKTNSVDVHYSLDLKNAETDTNFELFQQSPDPKVTQVTKQTFDDIGAYAFVVIE